MKKSEYESLCRQAKKMYDEANIALTQSEADNIEVADFGLNDAENVGLELVVYVNSELYCAKEMVLFPHQTCPEHSHIPFGAYRGKTETFRCRFGKVFLFVEGEKTSGAEAFVPQNGSEFYTAMHMITLNPGEQYTISPNTKHWFTSGDGGAVVSEFSTQSFDEYDVFTDPRIKRIPEITEED